MVENNYEHLHAFNLLYNMMGKSDHYTYACL